MIGPINRDPTELMKLLQEKDMKLYQWLEDSKSQGIDVVYISLGSIVELQKWSANAIYQGLNKLGCRVIWSLNDKLRPLLEVNPDDNPNFWVSGWLP